VIDEVSVLRIATVVGESREGVSTAIDDARVKAEQGFPGVRMLEIVQVIVPSKKGIPVFEVVCRVVFATNC
jgi:flavin-binding protein dodecin